MNPSNEGQKHEGSKGLNLEFFEPQNAEVWNFGFLIMQNDDSNNLRLRS